MKRRRMTAREIRDLQETCENYRKACERAQQMLETERAHMNAMAQNHRETEQALGRLREFVRDESVRAKAYGNQRLGDLFWAAAHR